MTRKLKSFSCAVVAALLASSFSMAFAQDADQARSWAASCSNCHGTNGVSSPGRETLAGMPEEMMIKKMQDFKAGRAPAATIMHQLAKGYDDAQIAAIAKYFAKQASQ